MGGCVGGSEHRGCQPGARSHPCSGLICGAITSQYLLEKSRVVFQVCGEGVLGSASHSAPSATPSPALSSALQAQSERNYHIFYEMLAGLPSQQRQRYCLQGAETYYYLNQVQCPHSPAVFFRGCPASGCWWAPDPRCVDEEDAQGRVTPHAGC